jgi:hypothetical protein
MRAMRIGNPERWRKWARYLAWRGVTRRRSPLRLSLLRQARGLSSLQSWYRVLHRYSTALSPLSLIANMRLAWSVQPMISAIAAPSGPRGALSKALATKTALVRPGHPGGVSPRYATPAPERGSSQKLLRDIIDRTQRIEQRVSIHSSLVFRNPVSPAGQEPPPMQASRAGDEWWKQSAPGPAARQSAPALTANLEQITDNVLSRLDRRISTWRERVGRM